VSFADSTSIPLQGLVGRKAPDFRLEDGTRLGELMQDGRGGVLDFSPGQRMRDSAMGWAGRIPYVAGPAGNDLGCDAGSAVGCDHDSDSVPGARHR
jgi:hypothetical protein